MTERLSTVRQSTQRRAVSAAHRDTTAASRTPGAAVHSLAAARGASERDAGHDAGMDISHLTLNAYLDEWLGLLRTRIQPTTLRSTTDMIDA